MWFLIFSISICAQLIIKRFVYFRIFLFEERKCSSILLFLLLGTGYYYFCLMFVYGEGVAGKGNLYFLKNTASENEMLSLPSLSTVGLIHPNFFQLFSDHTQEKVHWITFVPHLTCSLNVSIMTNLLKAIYQLQYI